MSRPPLDPLAHLLATSGAVPLSALRVADFARAVQGVPPAQAAALAARILEERLHSRHVRPDVLEAAITTVAAGDEASWSLTARALGTLDLLRYLAPEVSPTHWLLVARCARPRPADEVLERLVFHEWWPAVMHLRSTGDQAIALGELLTWPHARIRAEALMRLAPRVSQSPRR